MVIDEEFSNWDDSRRSIDLLALDRDANLVVIELKRTEDGGHMELQALRYAAMISAMTFKQAVDAHRHFLQRIGQHQEDAQSRILEFLGWGEPQEENFGQDVRIVLASANFSKELMTAVLWLNERDLDIRCIRLIPHEFEGRTLLDVQQAIPLPEAAEHQIRVREKEAEERSARLEHGTKAERYRRFWTGLLEMANSVLALHKNISPSRTSDIIATQHGMRWGYVLANSRNRAELYIGGPTKEENKVIFDELKSKRAEIEAAFGGSLNWERLKDETLGSRISANVQDGSFDDETTWPRLQEGLVDAMRRLSAALDPHVSRYCEGEKPVLPAMEPHAGVETQTASGH
jgi:hypothetical protein